LTQSSGIGSPDAARAASRSRLTSGCSVSASRVCRWTAGSGGESGIDRHPTGAAAGSTVAGSVLAAHATGSGTPSDAGFTMGGFLVLSVDRREW
jgi:hypothetical protein